MPAGDTVLPRNSSDVAPSSDLSVLIWMPYSCHRNEEVVYVGEAEGQTSKDLVDKALECLSCIL